MGLSSSKFPWLKILIGISLLLSIFSLLLFTPLRSWIGELPIAKLRMLKEDLGLFFPLIYVFAYAIATVVGIPATFFTLGAGAIFGLWQGVTWTLIGASIGAIAAFLIAKFLAREWVEKHFVEGDRLQKLDRGIAEKGFWFVLSIRLAPLFPFNLVNYLLGLTSLSVRDYSLATVIGIIPGTFAYTWLGQEGLEAFSGTGRWQLFGALGLLALLSLAPIVVPIIRRSLSKELK
jgi:uncharacterized membrane protein YdjX (TVP38/TMEM64 family)